MFIKEKKKSLKKLLVISYKRQFVTKIETFQPKPHEKDILKGNSCVITIQTYTELNLYIMLFIFLKYIKP